MNDDLERRLEQAGRRAVPLLGADRVDDIARRLDARPGHRRAIPWAAAAAAAAVLIVVGVAVAFRRDGGGTLQPVSPPMDTATPTSPPPTSTTTSAGSLVTVPAATTAVPQGQATTVPPGGPTSTTQPGTSGGGTQPATTPPTAPTTTSPPTAPPTTAPPVIPAPSFTVGVQRIGDRLVFTWPPYGGSDGTQFVLVRVTAAGLQHWPVDPARVARVVFDMSASRATIDHPDTTRAAWQLVVVGADRQVVAISQVVFSN